MKQCVATFAGFRELIKNFERTQLALTPRHTHLRTLFNFQFHVSCSNSGACPLFNSNSFKFDDVICFVACDKTLDLEFLS